MKTSIHGRFRLAVLALAVSLIFGAATTSLKAQQAPIELTMMLEPGILSYEYIEWLEDVWMPVFYEENPHIRVNIVPLVGNRNDAVIASVAAGVPYDIVSASHTLPMTEGVANRMYLPLDSYIAEWDDAQYMIPSVWAHTQWDGVTFAIPNHLPPRLISYNKTIFAESGLDPETPPASWEEMLMAARLTTRIVGDELLRRGFSMYVGNQNIAFDFELFAKNYGHRMLSEDYRTPVFHEGPGVETVNFMKQLYELSFPSGIRSSLSTSITGGFYNGEAAMIRTAGADVAIRVARDFPDAIDLGIFLPRHSNDYEPAASSSINSLAILRYTKYPDEAWKVMEHLNRRESLEMVAKLRGQLIPRHDVFPFAVEHMPETLPLLEILPQVVVRPKWPTGAGYNYTTALGEPLYAAVKGDVAPEMAIEEARRRVQLMLDDFWAGVQ